MSQEVLLDVRELIPRERHPKIFNTWEQLPVGDAIKLVNDHDPKPLYYEFSAERTGEFEWNAVERGPERWVVLIKRVAPASKSSASEGASRPKHGGCGCGGHGHGQPKTPGRLLTLDVSQMEPPQPMIEILQKIQELGPKDVLEVSHHREPVPLYPQLEESGFEHSIEKLGENRFRLRVWRKVED